MDPRLLDSIWNWLPAFRVVAETEHLPTASRRLHLSTSALSRTIRLLEDRVGRELFNRTGRRLILNTAGEQLLEAVEEAMRSAASGLRAVAAQELAGPVHVSTLGVLTNHYVLPALLELKAAHPALVPHLRNCKASEANVLLARGQLDVAFYYDALSHEDLSIEHLGVSRNSVYCGREHPLFARRRIRPGDVLAFEFSVPQIGDKGVAMDHWPVERTRRVGMRIELLWTNLEVCRSGRLLTVLPDVVAFPYWGRGELRRLPTGDLPPTVLHAAWRRAATATGPAAAVIAAVRRQIERVDRDLVGGRPTPRRRAGGRRRSRD
jgi:DNA-binding transcriptional LysR family regulator